MANKIRLLLAGDKASMDALIPILKADNQIVIVGTGVSAQETIHQQKELKADIILLDVNLPDMDGYTATNKLLFEAPSTIVILMSSNGEPENIRQAMISGAKDYIIKPFDDKDLLQAIKNSYANSKKHTASQRDQGQVLTLFSTKGGVGKTVIATNLAVALATKFNRKVAILDFNLQFGDIALCLNVLPKASIADVVRDIEHLDNEVLSRYMVSYNDNLDVLPAPFKPELAETIKVEHLKAILQLLKKKYQFIIIDTAPAFDDKTLTALDFSDLMFVVLVPDLTTTKNVKLGLETLYNLNYSPQKIELVMNRFNSKSALSVDDIEEHLKQEFSCNLPNDSEVVLDSVNKGIPFVVSKPHSAIAKAIFALAANLVNDSFIDFEDDSTKKKANKGVFSGFKNIFSKNVKA